MAPTAIRVALVEGQDGDGAIVEEDSFRLRRNAVPMYACEQVISTILGTREGAADAGLRLCSIGVCWTDEAQAAALRQALAARTIENVTLVPAFQAAVAMGQAVGGAMGYEQTGVLYIEPCSATLAVVDSADGSLCDVRRVLLPHDDDTAVAELAQLVSGAEWMATRPAGIYVVGSEVDVPLIKPALEAATPLTVSASEEYEMALARGAALASSSVPTTTALAYAQDPDALDDLDGVDAAEDSPRRRPALLVGSGLAVVAIAAVVALEVALAINIRPTVALQPTPNENHFVAPLELAPAPTQVAAPQPKLDLPGPVVPRVGTPQLPAAAAPAPAAPAPVVPVPVAPVLPAPAVPEPIVVPPILVPSIQGPGPETFLRPPVVRAPVQVPRQQPQLPQQQQRPAPASPPRVESPVPQAPVTQTPPGRGPFGGGPGRGGPGGGGDGPGGRGPFGGVPGSGGPNAGGPFGGDGPGGRGPFGGAPGRGGPGGGPNVGGPFGGDGPGGRGPFGGAPGRGGPGGGAPGGGGGPGAHGPFGGGPGGGGPGGGGRGGGGGGRGPSIGGGGGGGGHGPIGGGGGGGGRGRR